jgi:hypothetical protein
MCRRTETTAAAAAAAAAAATTTTKVCEIIKASTFHSFYIFLCLNSAKMTPSNTILCHYAESHYVECLFLFIVES